MSRDDDFLDFLDGMLDNYRRSRTIEERRLPRHRPDSPCIEVMRLEYRDNPKRGAFEGRNQDDALIFPAQFYAEQHHLKPQPFELPNIMKDGDEMAHKWTRRHYTGFASFDQLDMWMPTRKQRELVYDRPEACCRVYRVAKDRVLFGQHQIGFVLDKAEPLRHLTREEFVR